MKQQADQMRFNLTEPEIAKGIVENKGLTSQKRSGNKFFEKDFASINIRKSSNSPINDQECKDLLIYLYNNLNMKSNEIKQSELLLKIKYYCLLNCTSNLEILKDSVGDAIMEYLKKMNYIWVSPKVPFYCWLSDNAKNVVEAELRTRSIAYDVSMPQGEGSSSAASKQPETTSSNPGFFRTSSDQKTKQNESTSSNGLKRHKTTTRKRKRGNPLENKTSSHSTRSCRRYDFTEERRKQLLIYLFREGMREGTFFISKDLEALITTCLKVKEGSALRLRRALEKMGYLTSKRDGKVCCHFLTEPALQLIKAELGEEEFNRLSNEKYSKVNSKEVIVSEEKKINEFRFFLFDIHSSSFQEIPTEIDSSSQTSSITGEVVDNAETKTSELNNSIECMVKNNKSRENTLFANAINKKVGINNETVDINSDPDNKKLLKFLYDEGVWLWNANTLKKIIIDFYKSNGICDEFALLIIYKLKDENFIVQDKDQYSLSQKLLDSIDIDGCALLG